MHIIITNVHICLISGCTTRMIAYSHTCSDRITKADKQGFA